MELHILKNVFAEMLSNDDDSRFYCTSHWTSVGGTCSISYVLTSKVCILVILHIIIIMLTKSNSKKKRPSIFWAICTRSKNSEVNEPANMDL